MHIGKTALLVSNLCKTRLKTPVPQINDAHSLTMRKLPASTGSSIQISHCRHQHISEGHDRCRDRPTDDGFPANFVTSTRSIIAWNCWISRITLPQWLQLLRRRLKTGSKAAMT